MAKLRSPWRALFICVLLVSCLPAQTYEREMIPTPFVENGVGVELELVFSRPSGVGPFPTLVFNHGSTGTGADPSRFGLTIVTPAAATFFNARGWLVVYPQRRGRGRSGGTYAEGLSPDGSGYSCNPAVSLPGVDRALADLDVVMDHLRLRREVDPRRMVMSGQSRGGLLAVVYAGTRPGRLRGAINFAGGWMSSGCAEVALINTPTFVRGAPFPGETLWFYGKADSFYPTSHSLSNHASFVAAGGRGQFELLETPAGADGHHVVAFPELWGPAVDAYLERLPEPVLPSKPVAITATLDAEGLLVEVPRVEGDRYRIEVTDDAAGGNWDPFGTITFGDGASVGFRVPADRERRFVRVIVD